MQRRIAVDSEPTRDVAIRNQRDESSIYLGLHWVSFLFIFISFVSDCGRVRSTMVSLVLHGRNAFFLFFPYGTSRPVIGQRSIDGHRGTFARHIFFWAR